MSQSTVREYEIMLLITPEVSEADAKAQIETVKKTIADAGGEVTFEDFWGRRSLAYPVQKHDTGYYHVMLFRVEGSFLLGFEKDLRLNKHILRHLVTTPPKDYQPITAGEVVSSEEAYVSEMVAKKAKNARRSIAKRNTPRTETSAPKTEAPKSKEQITKKLDEILGDV